MKNINEEKLLEYLQESLQKEEKLNKEMKLENLEEWDSLAVISIINLYDELFNIKISGDSLRKCVYVKDILDLARVESKND